MAARGIQSVGLSHVAVYLFIRNKLFSQGCDHFFFFFSFVLLLLSSQRILGSGQHKMCPTEKFACPGKNTTVP